MGFPFWLPECITTAGYHFPNGPYVEYKGNIEPSQVEELKKDLEKKATDLIAEDIPIKIRLDVSQDDAKILCGELDPMYQSTPLLRLISVGDYFTCPCGGTHIEKLSQLKGIKIPKIKVQKSKGLIQVRYEVIQ